MRRWFFDVNYYRWDRVKRRVRRLGVFIVLLILLAGGALAADAYLLSNKDVQPSKPTKAVETAYDIPSKTFTTKYFELEAPESWEFQKKPSGPNRFVYYNFRHKLVRGYLMIYVNEPPPPEHLQATRLLPVKLGADRLLQPDIDVTGHCNKTKAAKKNVGEQAMKFKNITFTCDNDATWFSVLIGLDGATPQMKIKRPDGTTATYVIFYQDSSASPVSTDLLEVIQNFKIL